MADHKTPLDLGLSPAVHDSLPILVGQLHNAHLPRDPQAERKVRRDIEAAASLHTQLLGELATTSDAPGQLGNNELKRDHAEKRVNELNSDLQGAIEVMNVRFKNHKSYRDSVGKKLVYTLLHKKDSFDNRVMQKEKEYHDALARRRKVEILLAELNDSRAALLDEAKTLEEQVKRHSAAHGEIDKMYATIFDGPTPGFPDEDEQESRHQQAKTAHSTKTVSLKATVRGVMIVQAIKVAIQRAAFEASRASLESRSSLLDTGYVRVILARCIRYLDRGIELSEQLTVGNLVPLDQSLKFSRDVARRSTKTRQEIVAVTDGLKKALEDALEAQKGYVEEIKALSEAERRATRQTARSLEDERQALQQMRQSAFETTVGFGAAAPPYHECCDRATAFVEESEAQCALLIPPYIEELPDDAQPPPEYASATITS
ncbi:hypothetical protein PT974_12495 [Cladobotryum mycophilum]|uniref:Uncharacterized protein n=1 Tax=Cladobotryum mycophilum TaxID=491253 RepID=A0ABR0S850_9HYPO